MDKIVTVDYDALSEEFSEHPHGHEVRTILKDSITTAITTKKYPSEHTLLERYNILFDRRKLLQLTQDGAYLSTSFLGSKKRCCLVYVTENAKVNPIVDFNGITVNFAEYCQMTESESPIIAKGMVWQMFGSDKDPIPYFFFLLPADAIPFHPLSVGENVSIYYQVMISLRMAYKRTKRVPLVSVSNLFIAPISKGWLQYNKKYPYLQTQGNVAFIIPLFWTENYDEAVAYFQASFFDELGEEIEFTKQSPLVTKEITMGKLLDCHECHLNIEKLVSNKNIYLLPLYTREKSQEIANSLNNKVSAVYEKIKGLTEQITTKAKELVNPFQVVRTLFWIAKTLDEKSNGTASIARFLSINVPLIFPEYEYLMKIVDNFRIFNIIPISVPSRVIEFEVPWNLIICKGHRNRPEEIVEDTHYEWIYIDDNEENRPDYKTNFSEVVFLTNHYYDNVYLLGCSAIIYNRIGFDNIKAVLKPKGTLFVTWRQFYLPSGNPDYVESKNEQTRQSRKNVYLPTYRSIIKAGFIYVKLEILPGKRMVAVFRLQGGMS